MSAGGSSQRRIGRDLEGAASLLACHQGKALITGPTRSEASWRGSCSSRELKESHSP